MKIAHTISFWEKYPDLVHGFSTKALGNISFRTEDKDIIRKRRELLTQELGITWKDILVLPLTHSNRILSIPRGEKLIRDEESVYVEGGHIFPTPEKPLCYNPDYQLGIDAVVTNAPGIFPVVTPADCAAIGFFDPSKKVIALAHAGLVGAVNEIVPTVIQCMNKEYACAITDIEVVIYPAIRNCHYNLTQSGLWKVVKETVTSHLGASNPLLRDEMFDLQGLIQQQLVSAGILEKHIFDTGLCTVCNSDMLYSNFKAATPEGKATEGRFAAILGMKK